MTRFIIRETDFVAINNGALRSLGAGDIGLIRKRKPQFISLELTVVNPGLIPQRAVRKEHDGLTIRFGHPQMAGGTRKIRLELEKTVA